MSEPDVSDLLTVPQAIAIIDAAVVSPRVVDVALADADGLVLAADVRADRDYPPFDRSMMDGYAVRAADVANAPVELEVVGEVAAGGASRAFAPGQSVAIMTGAPLPADADGVVPVEDVEGLSPSPTYSGERAGERGERSSSADAARRHMPSAPPPNPLPASGAGERMRIRVLRATAPGRFIARQGSDAQAGDVVIARGTRIGPAQLAAMATVGAARLPAFARPRVAVLSTGNEIIAPDRTPTGSQIRNSNSIMLASLLKRLGCDVTDLGSVRDEQDAVRAALLDGMRFDVLFVTGGMSMGAYDFVPRKLIELGADLRVTKLRIKPGKPFVFAERDGRYVFGLPGNPVSAFVCTVRLASRLIARMCGETPAEKWIDAKLSDPLPANGPREFYQPVFCGGGVARPLKWKASSDVFTLAACNALLVRAENEPALPAGRVVRVWEV